MVIDYRNLNAENLKPLHKKLKKDVEYYFDKKDQEQIQKIKLLCKNLPKLYFPDENKIFTYIVESDASEISYGGVLKYKYDKECNCNFSIHFLITP